MQAWLVEVETGMKAAVRCSLREAVATRERLPRQAWLSASPSFVVFAANKIWLTAQVELVLYCSTALLLCRYAAMLPLAYCYAPGCSPRQAAWSSRPTRSGSRRRHVSKLPAMQCEALFAISASAYSYSHIFQYEARLHSPPLMRAAARRRSNSRCTGITALQYAHSSITL